MAPNAVPVIVGVGDFVNRSTRVEDARDPASLMVEASNNALNDIGLCSSATADIKSRIDSISVVNTWTWSYVDLPGHIGQKLGLNKLAHKVLSDHHGDQSVRLLDHAARKIARKELEIAVVTGGEALASLSSCRKAQVHPPDWPAENPDVRSISNGGGQLLKNQSAAGHTIRQHGLELPIQVYPLYENAFRAWRKQSLSDNNAESAKLYGQFARVAEQNLYSWNYGKPAPSADYIGTPSKNNRMICTPYPLLMNAFNTVNLAAAFVVMSVETAKALGIPESKWVYPLAGAGCNDGDAWWLRRNLHSSASITRSIDSAIDRSGIAKDQIDLFDIYSCFPIVPKLAGYHLGVPIDGSYPRLTVLGGLTSFGGAGNNYSLHAVTAMVRTLRESIKTNGLILANGGVSSYHHTMIISSSAPKRPYPVEDSIAERNEDILDVEFVEKPEGSATIETYTVTYGRDGKPEIGSVVGRLAGSNARFVAVHGDSKTLQMLADDEQEPIGREGRVSQAGDGRNVFYLNSKPSKL